MHCSMIAFSYNQFALNAKYAGKTLLNVLHSCHCGLAGLHLLLRITGSNAFTILGNYVNDITLQSAGYIYSRCTVQQENLHRSVSTRLPEQNNMFSVPVLLNLSVG